MALCTSASASRAGGRRRWPSVDERIRGKRKNQVGGFGQASFSTFALLVARLVRALAPRARSQWLGAWPGKARRSSKPHCRGLER